MGRPRKTEPRYLEHSASGRGRAVWYDASGDYHEKLLPGPFRSDESLKAYARLILEEAVAPKGATIPPGQRAGLSLVEVLDAYHSAARDRYRDPHTGKPTNKLIEHRIVIRALREPYGETPAAEFGPLKLKAVRQSWVIAGLSRGEVNRRANIARNIFKWAVAQELVPVATYQALKTVDALKAGETAARETEPIGPVEDAVVNKTLPHLNRMVRGLVEFQRHTGCRPGEACALRPRDIDRSGDVWLYRPPQHKTKHRGRTRTIAIGPKAQAALAESIKGREPDAYMFSPAAALREMHEQRAKDRRTPRYPSHMTRNKKRRVRNPKRKPADHYTAHSYSVAVARACDLAFPAPASLRPKEGEGRDRWWRRLTPGEKAKLREWRKAHRWHPNQLRHSFATRVRKEYGLEAAQVLLGHARADVTQLYAERDEAVAVAVAGKIG